MAKKLQLEKIVILLLITPLTSAIGALVLTGVLKTLWDWYLTAYGPGPSYGAWYGISVIASLIVERSLLAFNVKTDEVKTDWGSIFGRMLGLWLAYAAMLGLAYLVGKICGWL